MIESLKPLGLNVLSLCLDTECWIALQEKGYPTHLCCKDISGFATIDSKQFQNVTFYKLDLIGRILKEGYNVLYTDGDIVYKKDPFSYLFSVLDENPNLDCIIQDDLDPRGPSTTNLCTGFFWIRATPTTIQEFSFDASRITVYNQYAHDQDFFNAHVRDKLIYHSLDQSLFPNGAYYDHVKYAIPDAYLVHFNFMIGHSKKYVMIQTGMWNLPHKTPRHTIKQMYLPQSWGLGDSLRGYFSLAKLCRKYGFALEYDYSLHPISECLENNHCTPIRIDAKSIPVYPIENLKDLEQTFVYLATRVESETFVPLTTNTWYLADGVTEDTKQALRTSLIPTAELQEAIDKALSEYGSFSAIHIRMGDQTLRGVKSVQHEEIYEAIQRLDESSSVVFSDDAALKDFLKEQGIRVSSVVSCHLSDKGLERSHIQSTLVDFFCLSKASRIYTWSAHAYGSGFVDWCAELFTIPTFALPV
jgi:hypothetical protein